MRTSRRDPHRSAGGLKRMLTATGRPSRTRGPAEPGTTTARGASPARLDARSTGDRRSRNPHRAAADRIASRLTPGPATRPASPDPARSAARRRAVKLAVVVQRYGAGDQRRRRAARALHRRTSRAARRGRGADDLRDRLRHVAQRAAAGRRAGQRRAGAPVPGQARARPASSSARRSRPRVRRSRTRSATSSTGSTPKVRPARR